MNLSKFINTQTGKILTSILLGLGLATLFRSICKGQNCKIKVAPNFEEITNKIYKFDNKCYNMQQNITKCNNKKQIYT
jgi:hypothetical protein